MIIAACVSASLGAGHWTCEDCDRAVQTLSEISTSEEAINVQIMNLVNEMCPTTEVPDNCEAFLPDFWRALAMRIWPEAWSHLCGDLETCDDSGHKLTCEECQLRVDWALDTLRDPVVEAYWVQTLEKGSFCADNYSGIEDLCKSYVKQLLPKMLYLSSGNYWVPNFCNDFGCQES